MSKKKQVIDKIADAFAEETYPHGIELYIPSANHIFDAKQAEASLNYEGWDKIPLEALIRNRDRMSYLTEPGFRFMLSPPDISETYSNEIFTKRTKILSTVQAEAVLSFFEAYKEIYPPNEWSLVTRYEAQIDKAILFWRSRADL